MIKAGIIGSTGYAGQELVRLLTNHKSVEIKWFGSKSYINKDFSDVYQNFFKIIDDKCLDDNMEKLAEEVDIIFTATPHGFCSSLINEEILSKVKVIDLSADFRIKDTDVYEEWYELKHKSPQFLKSSVYGLCEINRELIKNSNLVANPGCYPTCTVLSVYPLLKEGLIDETSIIVDAKSGASGTGRSAKTDNLFCEINENIKAYGVTNHRHTPEIEEQMSYAAGKTVKINFTPHLIPMNRGILTTIYASLRNEQTYEEIKSVYDKYYSCEKFIRILDKDVLPQTRWVKGSNFTDINFKIDSRTNRIIIIAVIDNLVKGAAGQAVQNMNIMFKIEETTGLIQVPMFP
ncbi:MAG: N-acetyl-gamma-glutamyl-phosphate reductase [Tissierellia bacterium]|jgi:N-acetyl-gamma-glutamyl-phosphate reductase|nr:N-acetyl-gamma-glutamyl-phosphate reductase [Tissierellia bacterium]MDD3226818.1 N-acetyl-gamma-glutamyl-phosphate reductase [Tissierellia bacterium]MDD4678866.1 N-acetyl-gamma-glutamyl-phosphate reductase [Tissierellia bacterium]